MQPTPTTLRLILWPALLTLGVSLLRLWGELQGSVTNASGGRLSLLGISWLVFVFGAWFGWRLRRTGATPRLRASWALALLMFLGLAATAVWQFSQLDRSDTSEAGYQALRGAVQVIVVVAMLLALGAFAVWPRLAKALFAYGVLARLTVLALTWLAKARGWDTHYTKFGPSGIEREMADTMFAASVAQLGFWVPFTVLGGMLTGCVAAALAGRVRVERRDG